MGPVRTACIGVAIAAAFAGCHAQQADAVADEPVPVTAVAAAKRDLVVSALGVGTVQALATVLVRPRVDGLVTRIDFGEGQEVQPGAPIAQLDDRPYAALLAQARALRAKDAALLEQATADLDRNQHLFEQSLITHQSYDALRFQKAALAAAVAADQAAIDAALLQVQFCTVTAPCAGRTGARLVDSGSLVRVSDDRGFVVVTQLEPIEVSFALPQDRLREVLAAARSAPPAVVEALERDGGDVLARGALAFVDSQIDSSTAMIRLKARFANADRALWPGQLVMARVVLRELHGVVAVPDRAVVRGPSGPCAWAIGADGAVALHALTVGAQADGYTAVTDGLAADQPVVVDGQYRLRAGRRVRAHAPDADAAAPVVDAR